MARQRLLTDTCSVFMLLGFGEKLFTRGVLTRGDLVIHPQVWAETRKWHKTKKQKYQAEYDLLHNKLSSLAISRGPTVKIEASLVLIETAQTALGCSIGYSDRVQLASVLWADDMDLVTNDGPLEKVARAFEIEVFNAEHILLEALNEGVITLQEAQEVITKWKENGEVIKSANRAALRGNSLKLV